MATNETSETWAPATVNPADLVIHSNENAIMSLMDDNAWCATETDAQWQQAPIYVGGRPNTLAAASLPPLPIESTGFEHLMWNGDLSYSSYGSSPADNSVGVSRLTRQLRQQNLAMSPTEENPSIMRNMSSTSMVSETPTRSPTKSHRKRRSRRGRLYADMSYDGPETVFEDSDSHHSWTASDNLEDWCAHLRVRLMDFRRRKDRISIITSHLQTRQRRKVHSMANLWGLSHMSLGSGREKRMLLSKCELVKGPKRWNPTRDNWMSGLVDPRIVLVDNISTNLSADRLSECLKDAGLPVPQRLAIDYPRDGSGTARATAYAMYTDADDAITALLALDGTRPNWNASDAELEADYVRFPPGFILTDTLLNAFHTLPSTILAEFQRLHPSHDHLSSDSETEDDTTSTRKPSTSSTFVRDSGYMSSHDGGHSSSETSTKKRKRVPKIAGGYPCKECGRLFDRDGDRRKHEKNHNPKRNHVCEECGKAFLFPKDLRRHAVVHAGGVASSVESNESGFGVTQPIPIAGRRMHSMGRPVDRRVSRLSTSLG